MAIVRQRITMRNHTVNKQGNRIYQKAMAIARDQAMFSRILKPVSVIRPKVSNWGIEGLMGEGHVFSFVNCPFSACFPPSLISTYSLVSHTHHCHFVSNFLVVIQDISSFFAVHTIPLRECRRFRLKKNCANNFCFPTQLPIFLMGLEVFAIMQRGIGSFVYT